MKLPDWSKETAVVMASGPSLSLAQCVHVLHGRVKTIVVNSTFRLMPDATVIYGGDFLFWKTHHAEVKRLRGEAWTQDTSAAERYQINRVKGVNRPGLGQGLIHTNGSSGFQAINLAYLFGARRILLLGFDMKLGPNGEKHHHADHPPPMVQSQTFGDWIHKSGQLAADLHDEGIEVLNCTPGSALTCFSFSTIDKELK